MTNGQIACRYESIRNRAMANASDRLAGYSLDDLHGIVEAAVDGKPCPPLWEGKPPIDLCMLAVPTIWGEIQQRYEVQDLEGQDS